MKRTNLQNKSLHLWLTLLAKKMIEQGLDLRKVLKPSVEITPTMELVKDYLFRPIMQTKYDKDSTADLTTIELQGVIQDLDRFFLSKHKINLPFPDESNLKLLDQLIKEHNI
jgi:hypothetical protein